MADQILSVEDSTLQAVANAIKSKAGIASSTKLTFPDGFKSALQGIDAYAPAKKIAAATTTLNPSRTSYPIPAGVHTGNGKVRILTRNTNLINNGVAMSSNVVTPSSETQVIEPNTEISKNYFLQKVIVNAMDASGYFQVVTGTITFNSKTANFSVSGFNFTPVGFAILMQEYTGKASENKISSITSIYNGNDNYPQYTSGSYASDSLSAITKVDSTMKSGALEIIRSTHFSSAYFYGTYFYMIWGN